jgi:hypothetical protein
VKRYCWNIVQALNRLVNTIFAGTDKEYMSSRIYRYRMDSRLAGFMYRLLNRLEPFHCERAFLDAQTGFDPKDAVWK